jgi:hypothetical protein
MGRINNFLVGFYNLYCDLKIVKARREELKIFMSKAYTKDVIPVNEEVADLKQLEDSYQLLLKSDVSEKFFILKDTFYDSKKKITIDDLVNANEKDFVFIPKNLVKSTKQKQQLLNEINNDSLFDLYLEVQQESEDFESLTNLRQAFENQEEKEEYVCLPPHLVKQQITKLKNVVKSIEDQVLREELKNIKHFNKAEYLAENYQFFKGRIVDWLKTELNVFRDNPKFTEQAVENFVSYLYGDKGAYKASLVEKKNFENTLHHYYFDSIKEPGMRQIHDWFIAQRVMNQKAELVLKGVFHRLRFQETFSCSLSKYIVNKFKKKLLIEEKNVTYFALDYINNDESKILSQNLKKDFEKKYKIDDLIKTLFKIDATYAIYDNNRLNDIVFKDDYATSARTKKVIGFSGNIYEKRRILMKKNIVPGIKYLLPRVYTDISREVIENINQKVQGYGLELKIGYVYINNK